LGSFEVILAVWTIAVLLIVAVSIFGGQPFLGVFDVPLAVAAF